MAAPVQSIKTVTRASAGVGAREQATCILRSNLHESGWGRHGQAVIRKRDRGRECRLSGLERPGKARCQGSVGWAGAPKHQGPEIWREQEKGWEGGAKKRAQGGARGGCRKAEA